MSKKSIIIALVVLAVGGGVFAATRKPKIIYETETVTRGAIAHEVNVTGSIAPFKRIDLQPEVAGKVAVVHVAAGDEVKVGDALIDLDARDAQSRVASQRAAVDSARAKLAELVAGATAHELASAEAAVATAMSRRDAAISAKADAQISYDNAVAKANAAMDAKLAVFLLGYGDALTVAKDAVERLSAPMFTYDDFLTFSTSSAAAETDAVATRAVAKAKLMHLADAVATVKTAGTASAALDVYAGITADVVAVKTHLEANRVVLGYALGLPSTTLATYQANVSTALSALDAALQSLSSAKSAVELQVQLNAADTANAQAALTSAIFAVDTAEKTLVQAKADLALKVSGTRAETIAGARAVVAAEVATLSGLLNELAKRRITAPLDGVVTQVHVEPGETVSPSIVAVVINGKGRFEIIANISEVDIAKIAVGQPVRITLDAFPATEVWTGKVAFIDPAEKVLEGVIFYETKIVFDQEDDRLRSGMTANLDIETARREDALRVPIRALAEKNGASTVQVLVNGAPEERTVTTGIEDDEYAEALSGLTEGDLVVTGSSEE